ncbi:hypothetical protein MASR2M78_33680 [Treponema sp.]
MFFIVHNAYVLTMNSSMDVFKDGCVAVEGSSILEVGGAEMLNRYPGFERIDAEGGILIPGLINAHTHSGMIPFRSLGDDVPDRLRRLLFPLEKLMTSELACASASYACCELIAAGTTTFVDMYFFEAEIAKVVQKAGLRAMLGETVVDFPTCDSLQPHGGLAYAETFIPSWLGNPLITPSSPPTPPTPTAPRKSWKLVGFRSAMASPLPCT